MTTLPWPFGVNSNMLRDGYSPLPPDDMLRSEMERGAKQRRGSTGAPEIIKGRFRFRRAEYLKFRHFIDTEIKPRTEPRVYFRHPDDGELRICRFVVREGRLFVPSPAPAGGRFVAVELEAWRTGGAG